MTQQELDAMSEALRAKGLTWSQTSFAVSLVRNRVAAERERCAQVCLSRSANGNFRADTRDECAALIRGEFGA